MLLLFVAGALVAYAQVTEDRGTELMMFRGEVRTLPVGKVQRVAVGNGSVISTNVLDKEILLLAESAGITSLVIWTADGAMRKYTVVVSVADTTDIFRQLSRMLGNFPGVKVEQIGEHVVVSGATTKANLPRIDKVVGNFPKTINLVREEDVTMKKMVFLKVHLVEFKRSALQNLGVRWTQEITGPAAAFAFDVITSGGFTARQTDPALEQALQKANPAAVGALLPPRVSPPRAYLGIATSIASRINLAVQNGDAYILATPELSTRSGGEAKFLAGGQVPIVTPASGFSPPTVTYKDYGIKLDINPVADDSNNIVALIKTEINSLDPATTVQGNPGFLTRKTDSEVNVKAGETIVLSGLVNADLSNQVDKFPFLGDIPILGALFRSTEFRNSRTDLVVFVTPMIIDPNSTVSRERVEKGKEMKERFEGFLQKKGIVD